MALTQRMPDAPPANRLAWALVVVLATLMLGAIGLLVFQRISLSRRQQALEEAIWTGQVSRVRTLLYEGAGVNTPSPDGTLPLKGAIISPRFDVHIVALLLDHGARLQPGDLSLAASWSNAEIVKLLLAHGAKVNMPDAIDGFTPLIRAALASQFNPRRLANIEALLTAGANPNTREQRYGWTALMLAAQAGQTAIVQCLIAHGAEVSERSTDGATALMYAAQRGRVPVVKLLLAHGADLTPRETRHGRMALTLAKKYGHTAVVRLLQQRGAKG